MILFRLSPYRAIAKKCNAKLLCRKFYQTTENGGKQLIQRFKILQCPRDILMQIPYCWAVIQFITICTGLEAFWIYAIPYFTVIAMVKFNPGFPAPGAINHFRGKALCIVLHFPFFGCLDTQFVIVIYSGNSCIARNTIQAATGNKFSHIKLLFG